MDQPSSLSVESSRCSEK